MMYPAKRPLISILIFAAVFKVMNFLGTVTQTFRSPMPILVAFSTSSAIVLFVQIFGIIAAVQARPLGLKLFSVIQTVFCIMSIIYLVVIANQLFHPAASDYSSQHESDKMSDSTSSPSTSAHGSFSPPNNDSGVPGGSTFGVLLVSVSLFFIALDFISAGLAWKAYRQLLEGNDHQREVAMTTTTYRPTTSTVTLPPPTFATALPPNASPVPIVVGYPYATTGALNNTIGYPQPVNIVYVPTDAYNQMQTGRVIYQ